MEFACGSRRAVWLCERCAAPDDWKPSGSVEAMKILCKVKNNAASTQRRPRPCAT